MSTQITNLDDLSDEELANLDPSTLGSVTDSNVGTDPAGDGNQDQGSTENNAAATEQTDEDQSQGQDSQDNAADKASDGSGVDDQAQGKGDDANPKVEDQGAVTEEVKDKQDPAPAKKDEKTEEVAATPETIVAKLFAPFKANGKEMRVDNIDEALDLMRMGANYNKKMSGLKPNLKLLKMLQNNDLLDESKLEFLIDVAQKKPEAISKLIKDSGLDPLDLGDEQAGKYQRSNHKVTDQEMELEGVLDEINDSPAALRTLQVITKDWDDTSRNIVTSEPGLIKILNGHVESGVYDLIANELDRRRALGRLTNVPDLHAYKQLGDEMEAQGAFKHIFGGSSPKGQGTDQAPVVVKPKTPDAKQDEQRKQQRKAAGASAPAAPAKPQVNFNPLDMPEEEFLKLKPKFN